MKAKDIMTTNAETLDSNQTIQMAAEKMKDLGIGDLPVKTDGDIIGMVTDRDIVIRAVSHGLDPKSTPVVEAMTEGVIACNENDDLNEIAEKMGEHKVRRLLVTDAKDEFCGVVSLGDVVKNIDAERGGKVLAQISS